METISIDIISEVNTKEEMVDMLREIANRIENGNTSGYYPTFFLIHKIKEKTEKTV